MGWCQSLPDGRWRAYESEGSGSERVRANAIGATRSAAVKAARKKLSAKVADSRLEPHKLTLAAYLEHWVKHQKTQKHSAKGMARDEGICKALPASLSRRRLLELKPLPLQQWLDACALAEAPATTRRRYTTLHSALQRAVVWRLIAENPMNAVTQPPLLPRHTTALDEAGAAALIAKVAGTRYWAPAMVALTTGLRRGNVLALRWQDVDLVAGTVKVRKKFDEVPGEPVHVEHGDKSRKTRTLALMAATVDCLKAHKKQQVAEKLAAKVWREHGYVFPDRHGEAWRPSSFSVGWGRLETGVTFHELRHTQATLLLRAGVPVDAVAKRLGHSSPIVTMTVYAHVLEDADSAAVEKLETGLGAALSRANGTNAGTSEDA